MSTSTSPPASLTIRPSPAVRVRSVLAGTGTLRVGVLNLAHDIESHAMAEDGCLLFYPPPDSPERIFAVAPNLPAQQVTATVVDVAAVPLPDRIRGIATVAGHLGVADGGVPVPVREHLAGARPEREDPLLCLRPTHVWLQWRCETGVGEDREDGVPVPMEDYRTAHPDPLVGHEATWLSHLAARHDDAIRLLAGRMSPDLLDSDAVWPLALDRHGLVLRAVAARGSRDVRVRFERPVRCACEVSSALHQLVDAATAHR